MASQKDSNDSIDSGNWERRRTWGSSQEDYCEAHDDNHEDHNEGLYEWASRLNLHKGIQNLWAAGEVQVDTEPALQTFVPTEPRRRQAVMRRRSRQLHRRRSSTSRWDPASIAAAGANGSDGDAEGAGRSRPTKQRRRVTTAPAAAAATTSAGAAAPPHGQAGGAGE